MDNNNNNEIEYETETDNEKKVKTYHEILHGANRINNKKLNTKEIKKKSERKLNNQSINTNNKKHEFFTFHLSSIDERPCLTSKNSKSVNKQNTVQKTPKNLYNTTNYQGWTYGKDNNNTTAQQKKTGYKDDNCFAKPRNSIPSSNKNYSDIHKRKYF